MSLTLRHSSHPKHPLVLREHDVIRDDALCYICNKTIVGSPTFTCSESSNYIECQSLYLHKSCAELPSQISFYKHNQHPLDLVPAPRLSLISNYWLCDVCYRDVQFAYMCSDDCEFTVCVFCAFEQRALDHPGHQEHALTLLQRESLFNCDACCEKAEDSSYICTTCDFWIHKECAFSPFTIQIPTYHHHPLTLIYSIPKMHRHFHRYCNICQEHVKRNFWLYYCHKCTYFVHVKCATSSHPTSTLNEVEAEGVDNEPGLVEFPLHNEESLFVLIINQCCKLQLQYQGKQDDTIRISTTANDPPPHIIIKHWSHEEHPLVQLQYTYSENDDESNDYDTRVLMICDGCIQPITISHPSYYACLECGFFLHSFCATKLPTELLAGVSPFHPQHSLVLCHTNKFYNFVECGVCCFTTNGFYYRCCETCDIRIDIRCAFLPTKINHKSHKHHSLVQRPSSHSVCSVSNYKISSSVEYGCETCSNFQIDIVSLFYPSRMKHKYDDHPITLRQPPFFCEGVIYCEICEDQVDNQSWLYHCGECAHSFHYDCLRWLENVKLGGGSIKLDFNNQSHTVTLVLKRHTRWNVMAVDFFSVLHCCEKCGDHCKYFLECDGCGYLICPRCVTKIPVTPGE